MYVLAIKASHADFVTAQIENTCLATVNSGTAMEHLRSTQALGEVESMSQPPGTTCRTSEDMPLYVRVHSEKEKHTISARWVIHRLWEGELCTLLRL